MEKLMHVAQALERLAMGPLLLLGRAVFGCGLIGSVPRKGVLVAKRCF